MYNLSLFFFFSSRMFEPTFSLFRHFVYLDLSRNLVPRSSHSLRLRPVQDIPIFKDREQGRLLSAQARKSFQIFFVLGIFEEHAVFGEVEFDNLNFKRKAFINTLSTCQVEHFAIKRNSIWRQISLFDIACGNFAADEDLFM